MGVAPPVEPAGEPRGVGVAPPDDDRGLVVADGVVLLVLALPVT